MRPCRGSAVADENWVPPAPGGLPAVGVAGVFSRRSGARAGVEGAFSVVRAVRRSRPLMDRSWP